MTLDELDSFLTLHGFELIHGFPGKLWAEKGDTIFRSEWMHPRHDLEYGAFKDTILLWIEQNAKK